MDLTSQNRFIECWYAYRNACILTRELVSPASEPAGRKFENEILFLHGRFNDACAWDPLASEMSAQAHCSSLEFPGFGRSFTMDDRQMTLNGLVELTIEVARAGMRSRRSIRWTLIAHDLGALVAQMAALELSREPDPVILDLILISPVSVFGGTLSPGRLDSLLSRYRLRKLIRQSPRLSAQERARLRPPEPKVMRRISESWPGVIERGAWSRSMREFPGSVLVLRGAQDRMNRLDEIQQILKSYRDVEYLEHERAGHWLLMEDPVWVSEKVKTFLFRRVSERKAV